MIRCRQVYSNLIRYNSSCKQVMTRPSFHLLYSTKFQRRFASIKPPIFTSPLLEREELERLIENGDHTQLDHYVYQLLHAPMETAQLAQKLNDPLHLNILKNSISSKGIHYLLQTDLLEAQQLSVLMQRSVQLGSPDACYELALQCLEDSETDGAAFLPTWSPQIIKDAALLILSRNKYVTSFRLFKLFDADAASGPERDAFMRAFYDYLLAFHTQAKRSTANISTYLLSPPPSAGVVKGPHEPQQQQEQKEEEGVLLDEELEAVAAVAESSAAQVHAAVISLLMQPSFRPSVFLLHFNCLDLENLNVYVAKQCTTYLINNLTQRMLVNTRFTKEMLRLNSTHGDTDQVNLSHKDVVDLTSLSHGFVLLIAATKSHIGEITLRKLKTYLRETHGISGVDENSNIVLTKSEGLINKLFTAVRISQNIRRHEGALSYRNPLTIYISASELVQSVFPIVNSKEHIHYNVSCADHAASPRSNSSSNQPTKVYKYRDIMVHGDDGPILKKIAAHNYQLLEELQEKRNKESLRRQHAALLRFQSKHAVVRNRNRQNMMVRQILDLQEKLHRQP